MRRLLCPACAAKWPRTLHEQDRENGFQQRIVEIPHVKKPAVHHITINGVAQEEFETIVCDGCREPIPDGKPAVAVSMWRGGELAAWEKAYSQ